MEFLKRKYTDMNHHRLDHRFLVFLSLSSDEKFLISGSWDKSINILGVEKLITSRSE